MATDESKPLGKNVLHRRLSGVPRSNQKKTEKKMKGQRYIEIVGSSQHIPSRNAEEELSSVLL